MAEAQAADGLTFMAGCLPRTPFRELVPAVAAAGVRSMTLWPNVWRHARRNGLSLAGMRRILDDHGVALTDVDAYRGWAPEPVAGAERLGPLRPEPAREEFFEVCAALGGSTVVAVYFADPPFHASRAAEALAALCDDAARYGLRVALEFVAGSEISDAGAAWRVVELAGRANCGLVVDFFHHVRGAGLGAPGLLQAVPAERIYTVQFCDGPHVATLPPMEEARFHRRLPGDGELPLTPFLRTLRELGVGASRGVEAYVPALAAAPPAEAVRRLVERARRALTEAAWE